LNIKRCKLTVKYTNIVLKKNKIFLKKK